MGFEEPLPDDVRRLLENESPAVMARELLRVRELADSRAWMVVELAQTAGVKVTIGEVNSGARTLASVHDAAVAGILETRRLAERCLAEPAADLYRTAAHETRQILSAALGAHADGVPITDLPRQAREVASQRNAEKSRAYLLGAAVDDATRVLNEAGVAKENGAGQALTLWDRVELLVDERDGARARAGSAPSPFVVRREVGGNVVEIRAPTLPDLEGAIAAVTKAGSS